ncbi:MAG: RDD family protein [bacterium]|jgi:uncharacterized RDD family membrane protein YckC|nr:RDD family protein [bacterium]
MSAETFARAPGGPVPDAAALPAGFWRRLSSLIVDVWLVFVGFIAGDLVITTVTRGQGENAGLVLWAVLYLGYFTYLWGTRGQTLGGILTRTRVVAQGGNPLGYGRALARAVLVALSLLLCLVPAVVSAFMVGLGSRRRALHDLVLETEVVRL